MGEVVQQKAKRWLEDLAQGRFGQRIGSLSLRGLRITRDKDGNWHIGAMATLIDAIGAAAIISSVGVFKASVNLDISERAKEWLADLAAGRLGQEIETLALRGIQILQAKRGLILCNFIIPERLSDKDGNWHVGAIATLIDAIGAAAIVSSVGLIKASVNFDISYYSTAKIHEEVEIKTKVLGHKEKLTSVMVEIRRKENGEMVALGKQWMTSIKLKQTHPSKL
ncbi:hypothetical protein HHK36_025639 [Tetracentron sinense]|uniref:Acyl-coenzyme A thioesterase 13 n=1 Tax=Tetracentron sinense TaxID=13715 RepID=A0A834YJ40_TETSI|nr:hypothetical protein HHK36_025639 [Tetracentron sinense]